MFVCSNPTPYFPHDLQPPPLSLLFLLPHHNYGCGILSAASPFIPFHQPEPTLFVRMCSSLENSSSKFWRLKKKISSIFSIQFKQDRKIGVRGQASRAFLEGRACSGLYDVLSAIDYPAIGGWGRHPLLFYNFPNLPLQTSSSPRSLKFPPLTLHQIYAETLANDEDLATAIARCVPRADNIAAPYLLRSQPAPFVIYGVDETVNRT